MNARTAAAQAAAAVFGGSSLDDALAVHGRAVDALEQPLMRALAYGVVRERRLLEALLGQMLTRPLRDEPELGALIAGGLYQLRAMRVPAHAAVAETVAGTVTLGKPWAKGLANAVLRRYQREREALDARLPAQAAIRQSYPDWLVAAVRRDWPEQWRSLLAAGNAPAPMTLRVNARQGTATAYQAQLAALGFPARTLPGLPEALVLEEPLPVDRLPGFAQGTVSVQDASAQLAAGLLAVRPGQRVLDACAAPGGKTAHLLEREPTLAVLAVDAQAARLPRLRDNLARLGLNAAVIEGDASRPAGWWDGRRCDRILVDAPCSGTGVIRRHPDIKWLRRDRDVPAMAALQQRLLHALWPLLAPDGLLVYATCSILRAEGDAVIAAFLAEEATAETVAIEADWGEPTAHGRRIAPGDDFDGFYYACLRRR